MKPPFTKKNVHPPKKEVSAYIIGITKKYARKRNLIPLLHTPQFHTGKFIKIMKFEGNFEYRSETYTSTLSEERRNYREVRILINFP